MLLTTTQQPFKMTGGVLSKIEPEEVPVKKEIVIALIRAGAIGILTFYLVRWALRRKFYKTLIGAIGFLFY